MTFNMPGVELAELDDIKIVVEQSPWEFARTQRTTIGAHFIRLQQQRPLWNGRVLMLGSYHIRDRKLDGTCFETDYASLMAWCDWDFPDQWVYNFWAAAALRAADGAYLVGEMAPHTARAGQLYFPCGTPEPADVPDGRVVDLGANMGRELREETGIAVEELEIAPTWRLVRDRNFIALTREVRARQNAHELRDRIIGHLASDSQPEFSDIHILRGPTDLDARIPLWMTGFLRAEWERDRPL
jgi:8-oxo-dGTP pyrophosphatase MutT (NUDIX family)